MEILLNKRNVTGCGHVDVFHGIHYLNALSDELQGTRLENDILGIQMRLLLIPCLNQLPQELSLQMCSIQPAESLLLNVNTYV